MTIEEFEDKIRELEQDIENFKIILKDLKKNEPKVGKYLIGKRINAGTKFKIINIKAHKRDKHSEYVCLDEYVGKTATFKTTFTFDTGYCSSADFDEEYMNAIDRRNGRLRFRYDEVEILEYA